ncbi:MAG: NifU family protein [Bacteroidetes bacterium]|nr:NifU family protein [Bacteroidota bacterium]
MNSEKHHELQEKAKNAIDQIRPYLQADGGDVEFLELTETNDVRVRLVGACGSCPFSKMTLKGGIEASVMKAIPEIRSVQAEGIDY